MRIIKNNNTAKGKKKFFCFLYFEVFGVSG